MYQLFHFMLYHIILATLAFIIKLKLIYFSDSKRMYLLKKSNQTLNGCKIKLN